MEKNISGLEREVDALDTIKPGQAPSISQRLREAVQLELPDFRLLVTHSELHWELMERFGLKIPAKPWAPFL